MARSYAIVAVLALVAASMLVTPAAAYSITANTAYSSSNPCIDAISSAGVYSGNLVAATALNSSTNGALQLLAAAADSYVTNLAAASGNDGLACVANGTAPVGTWAQTLWTVAAVSPGAKYYRNVTSTLSQTDVANYGSLLLQTTSSAASISSLCRIYNSKLVSSFVQAITFNNFNAGATTAATTGLAAAEQQAATALYLAVLNVAYSAYQASVSATYTTITGLSDPSYSSALALFASMTSTTSAGGSYRRRMLALSDSYTVTTYASTLGGTVVSGAVSSQSASAWTAAVNKALTNLGYQNSFSATGGASSLSVSLLTLGAALLVLLFGF